MRFFFLWRTSFARLISSSKSTHAVEQSTRTSYIEYPKSLEITTSGESFHFRNPSKAMKHARNDLLRNISIYVIKIDDLHEKATTANHRFPHSPTPVGIWWWRVGICGFVWVGYVLNLCFFKHCLCSAKTENHPATQTESCALCERNLVVLVWRLSALGGCPHGLNGF